MYKKFSILVLVVFLTACNKDDVEEYVVEPFDGIIRASVNLSEWKNKTVDINSHIATVSLIYRGNGQESEFATADFVNGGFTMELPTPPENYLRKPDQYFDCFKLSNKNAKMFQFNENSWEGFEWWGSSGSWGYWHVGEEEEQVLLEGNDFIIWNDMGNESNRSYFVAYNEKGKIVGYFGYIPKNPDWYTFPSFWYADNDISFGYKRQQTRVGINYNISLKKGWNIVIGDNSMTSNAGDFEWRFALDEKYFEN